MTSDLKKIYLSLFALKVFSGQKLFLIGNIIINIFFLLRKAENPKNPETYFFILKTRNLLLTNKWWISPHCLETEKMEPVV